MEKTTPLLDEFYDDVPYLTPEKCVRDEVKKNYADKVVSQGISTAVLFWTSRELLTIPNIINECEPLVDDAHWKTFLYKNKVVFVVLRIGAPVAAALIEELRIFGIRNFIALGRAGCIDKDFDETQVVVVNRAIRDEGTSLHYLPPSVYVDLDKELADKISEHLKGKGIKTIQGTTWTTDAFYRETSKRIAKRISQGAISVEMESAALAAVAKFYGLKFGQFVWFSDKVCDKDWSWIGDATKREGFVLTALEFANTLGEGVAFRKANIKDADKIQKMQVVTFSPLLKKYKDHDTNPATETLERVKARFDYDNVDHYLITLQNETIGYIRIQHIDKNTCKLSQIFILPSFQGRGYGQMAMKQAELVYPMVKKWILDTIKQEAILCRLYEKMGYVQTGAERKIKEKMDIVYYEKHI